MNIVLASSSPFRKELLKKICNDFDAESPDIDESQIEGEAFDQLSLRLATEKAKALAHKHPNSLIIGSDQVASIDNTILRKPITKENNFLQLQRCQGKTAVFHTGICLLNTQTQHIQTAIERTDVTFRSLTDDQINQYIDREDARRCAGGFKMEGLGIALFESIKGEDPNALIGLPLIQLIKMLENEGVAVL